MVTNTFRAVTAFAAAVLLQAVGWLVYKGNFAVPGVIQGLLNLAAIVIFLPGTLAELALGESALSREGKDFAFWVFQVAIWFVLILIPVYFLKRPAHSVQRKGK